jgi:hypothetical protein
MIEDLAQDLYLLQKADSLIGRIWVNVVARKFGLFALASLITAFGLGMANLAGFYAFRHLPGRFWQR